VTGRAWRRAAVGGLAAAAAAAGLARAALLVVRVDGLSMAPSFQPGDALLTVRRWLAGPVRRGDVVVFRLPAGVPGPDGLVVKRVIAVAGDTVTSDSDSVTSDNTTGDNATRPRVVPAGRVYLRGDGTRSYDSRMFGAVPLDHVSGRVIARLSPPRGQARKRAQARKGA
jgi:signal peptidase I